MGYAQATIATAAQGGSQSLVIAIIVATGTREKNLGIAFVEALKHHILIGHEGVDVAVGIGHFIEFIAIGLGRLNEFFAGLCCLFPFIGIIGGAEDVLACGILIVGIVGIAIHKWAGCIEQHARPNG